MAVAVGAFHEIVVIGKPEEAWGTGLGLALIASLSVLVPVSLVAAAPADVVKKPFTPPVPLTDRAAEILKKRHERSEVVFRNLDGAPFYHTWLDQQHAAVRATLKLPADFVLHSLRHTFGTRLGESGADAFTIMKLMGHSTITVSQKHVHPSTDAMKAAIRGMSEAALPKVSNKVLKMAKRVSAANN